MSTNLNYQAISKNKYKYPAISREEFLKAPYNDLFALTGIDQPAWSKIFSGTRSMTLRKIIDVSNKLNVDPKDLACWILERMELHATGRQPNYSR